MNVVRLDMTVEQVEEIKDVIQNYEKGNGSFNIKTNRKGLTRDHILSRKCGFENGLFPEILRHPANCNIITHGKNSSKGKKSGYSIEELFLKIENYTDFWEEQDIVLNLINEWKSGKRFSADNYRRKSHASSILGI